MPSLRHHRSRSVLDAGDKAEPKVDPCPCPEGFPSLISAPTRVPHPTPCPRASPWIQRRQVGGWGTRGASHHRSSTREPNLPLSYLTAGKGVLAGEGTRGSPSTLETPEAHSAHDASLRPSDCLAERAPRMPGGRGPGRGSGRFCF